MRATISTGRRHQKETAAWVRRRLADASGHVFRSGASEVGQRGVVLADGVGLGKTWEALAASALLLIEAGKRRVGGGRRKYLRRRPARVLVICPPGLVTKWSREIRDPNGFSHHLRKWARKAPRSRQFVVETLSEPYELRRLADLHELPSGVRRRRRDELEAGTYVCNWNLLRKGPGPGRGRLRALRSQRWDVVILDEAHHREARRALQELRYGSGRIEATLLLTATPFQLEPREVHQLFRAALEGHHGEHKLLSRQPLRSFVAALSEFFKGGPRPSRASRRESETVLRQIVARNMPKNGGRCYHLIDVEGRAHEVPAYDRLPEADLRRQWQLAVGPSSDFEVFYLANRLKLADGDRTFVATRLRQLLSTPGETKRAVNRVPPSAPKLDALRAWATERFQRDLMAAAQDGFPRKLLVFSSFVRSAVGELQSVLEEAFRLAYGQARQSRRWEAVASNAKSGLPRTMEHLRIYIRANPALSEFPSAEDVVFALGRLADDPGSAPFYDLFGHPRFCRLVRQDLQRRLDALATTLAGHRLEGWSKRFRRREQRAYMRALSAVGPRRAVATYAGHDDRRERDVTGEAFRSPLSPWALVASNVGSEGIDLHTYCAHLVHFDLEWNPAKMEQREGRTDRLGRMLKDPVNIYYLLVRGTYDERMLHQLVARQRWHTVLLGAAGKRVDVDEPGDSDAPWLDRRDAELLSLDLRPRRG